MQRAKEMALKALELDESLAEAHTSLGWVTFVYDWDWPAAGRHFRRAIELNPRYSVARQWHSWFLLAMGRVDEALAEGRIALQLDPASVSIRRSMGWLEYYARRPAAAIEHLRKAVEMNPDAEENHRLLGLACLCMGLLDQAESAFREAIANSDSPALSTAGLARVAVRKGRRDEARAILEQLQAWRTERYINPAAFAMVHLELGNVDEAFEWLERAYQDRRGWLAYLRVEPDFDPLRADPRFGKLLERMRLA